MKSIVLRISLSLMIATGSAAAIANDADVSTLLSLEQKWVDANRTQDRDTLNSLLDDSYVADTPTGKVTKADQLGVTTPTTTESLHNLTATVDGDTAIVSGENYTTNAKGATTKFAFVDKFVRRDGKWRVISSYVTR
jgi:hypothetical protein